MANKSKSYTLHIPSAEIEALGDEAWKLTQQLSTNNPEKNNQLSDDLRLNSLRFLLNASQTNIDTFSRPRALASADNLIAQMHSSVSITLGKQLRAELFYMGNM